MITKIMSAAQAAQAYSNLTLEEAIIADRRRTARELVEVSSGLLRDDDKYKALTALTDIIVDLNWGHA